MKITKQDQVFRNPRICYIDPKTIELDRVLINLFLLLKHNGQRPVTKSGRKLVTIDVPGPRNLSLKEIIERQPDNLRGFDQYPEITRRWLESDLLDIVYRGIPDREVIASPRPLHLYAYRLRNPKHCRDYNVADQIHSMIWHGQYDLKTRLRDFLIAPMEPNGTSYYDTALLDLDTLFILRLSSDPQVVDQSPGQTVWEPETPLCIGQARLMCEDIQRLLAYENSVPRHVLIGYLRTILGLHVGLYMLKLFQLLPGWVNTRKTTEGCLRCQSSGANCASYASCLYRPLLLVDMGEDYRTRMAEISRLSAESHYARISDYIRAVFATNQLLSYAENAIPKSRRPKTVADTIHLLDNPDDEFNAYFRVSVNRLFPQHDEDTDEEEKPEIQRIREMDIPPFEKYVELIAFARTGFHRRYLTQLVDELLQKNEETGAAVQGKARANGRRFYLGSRLLETLVQIAVLEARGSGSSAGFRSRPILINDFVKWLEQRYGFVIDGSHLPDFESADIRDYEAFRGNRNALKSRLREIGFFTDLSDAYNAQTIRPRYPID